MAVVHARGLGQVAPRCRGGRAPLGLARPTTDVTCWACMFAPLGEAFGALAVGITDVTTIVQATGGVVAEEMRKAWGTSKADVTLVSD